MKSEIFSKLIDSLQLNRQRNITDFNNIMSFAKKIMNSDQPHRIYDLVYTLGKPYQFEIVNMFIKGKLLSAYCVEHLFFKKNNEKYQLYKTDEFGQLTNYVSVKDKKIHPSEYLVFTFPWCESRLINAFNSIGKKVGNTWSNDPLNHRVIIISPLNISYVYNGYHSTVINIIGNESTMTVTEELNLLPIYNDIYTDGGHFKKKKDNSIIDKVASVEFAAIFEIGRLIMENDNLKLR